MMSRSYTNLRDLASGNFPPVGGGGFRRWRMLRVMTVPGMLAELDDDDRVNNVSSDVPSSVMQDRIIIVVNQLSVRAESLPDDMEVIFIGSLRVEVDVGKKDEVSQTLLERFNCVPAFLPPELSDRFYHGFLSI